MQKVLGMGELRCVFQSRVKANATARATSRAVLISLGMGVLRRVLQSHVKANATARATSRAITLPNEGTSLIQ